MISETIIMLPVVAIVGRPNVGKSTLFNRLTRTRDALVSDIAGLTRDRHYGIAQYQGENFIIIDTGGLAVADTVLQTTTASAIEKLIAKQAWQAIEEAQIVLFVVDARSGLTAMDEEVARKLRKIKSKKDIFLVANKLDGLNVPKIASVAGDFYALGLNRPYFIAAEHGDGVRDLMDLVVSRFGPVASLVAAPNGVDTNVSVNQLPPLQAKRDEYVKIAFIGRPNVGKSTLVNRILGEDRVIVSDLAGTTRDAISIDFTRRGKNYTLIDTAGIRRRGRVKDKVEKFSVVKSLQAIELANVVVLVLDAQETVAEQDLHLLGFALESGRSLVIAINKWDGLTADQREHIRRVLDRRLVFVDFAPFHFISALHGTGVGDLFPSIDKVYAAAMKQLKTPEVTKILIKAVNDFPPPLVGGRRIKLRYAHVGGHNPPVIVIHGNQTESVPENYRKYLERTFRHKLRLVGTPIRIELRTSLNPYKR